MSKLSYKDISLSKPKFSRDVKGDDNIFHEELRLRSKASRRAPAAIYRPGQAPAGFDEEDEGQEDYTDLLSRRRKQEQKLQGKKPAVVTRTALVTKKREPRKIHTATIVEDAPGEEAEPEVKIDVSKLEVQGDVTSSEEESEEDENTSRRARARMRFKEAEAKREQEEKEAAAAEDVKEEAEEESSEYETDTSEEEEEYSNSRVLLKPVFVSKKDRETVEERKRMEQEEIEAQEALERRAKERKLQSRQLVIDEIKREEEMEANGKPMGGMPGEEVLPDDNDELNEEEDLERWKIRELTRIKRDKEKDAEEDQEALDVERRRNMTDKEVEEENAKQPRKRREKGSMRYLQKYYHPGAFYQDNDEDGVRLRDFAQATGEDYHVDRTLLPKILQVKKYGHKSRTKYTHLVDQVNPFTRTFISSPLISTLALLDLLYMFDG